MQPPDYTSDSLKQEFCKMLQSQAQSLMNEVCSDNSLR